MQNQSDLINCAQISNKHVPTSKCILGAAAWGFINLIPLITVHTLTLFPPAYKVYLGDITINAFQLKPVH